MFSLGANNVIILKTDNGDCSTEVCCINKGWTVLKPCGVNGCVMKFVSSYCSALLYSRAPNENIVQNYLNIALLNVF